MAENKEIFVLTQMSEFDKSNDLNKQTDIIALQDGKNVRIDSEVISQQVINKVNPKFVERKEKGQPNGVATLDENGKVPSVQLPPLDFTVNEIPIDKQTPTPTQNGVFIPTQTGIYPNFGGLEYSQQEFDNQDDVRFIFIDGRFEKQVKSFQAYGEVKSDDVRAVGGDKVYDYTLKEVKTIAELRTIVGEENQTIRLLGYYEIGDKPPLLYKWVSGSGTDDGGSTIVSSGGYWSALFGDVVCISAFGVKSNSNFDAREAWNNKLAFDKMMLIKNIYSFKIDIIGTVYFLGSIDIYTDNITLEIIKGCKIIGRYDDISIPESNTTQRGALLGVYKVDDVGYEVTRKISDVTVILNGDISTEYNDNHSVKNNNVVVGFGYAINCKIIGEGGVSASDWRGINWDYKSVNCYVDISYIKNTYANPLQFKGWENIISDVYCRVKRITDCNYGDKSDTNASVIINNQNYSNIIIDNISRSSILQNKSKHVIVSINSGSIECNINHADNYEHFFRNVGNTNNITIKNLSTNNMESVLINTTNSTINSISISELISDNTLTDIVYQQSNINDSIFNMYLSNNDVSMASYAGFEYFRKNSLSTEVVNVIIKNNKSPRKYKDKLKYQNILTNEKKYISKDNSKFEKIIFNDFVINNKYISCFVSKNKELEVCTYRINDIIANSLNFKNNDYSISFSFNSADSSIDVLLISDIYNIKYLIIHN